MTYDVGDLVRISTEFRDSSLALVDPTTVIFRFKDPSANTTSYVYNTDAQLVKDSTGKYHTDIDVDEDGTWWYRWESTGTGQAAEEGTFIARDSQFD